MMTLIFYLIYLVLCILYILSNYKSMKDKMIYYLLLVMMLPFFGLFYLIVITNLEKKSNHEHLFVLDDENKNDLIIQKVEREKELNQVPLEEALSINSYKKRREMIMYTLLSEDLLEYLAVLKMALNNDDSETTHYATAVITQIQSDILNTVNLAERKYHEEPDNEAYLSDYEECLYQLLISNVFDRRNLFKFISAYDNLYDDIKRLAEIDEKYLNHRIQLDLDNGNFVRAKQCCDLYIELYPASEDMVLNHLKYYVNLRDRKGLDEFLVKLKELPVRLTNNTIQYIRFLTN